MKSVEVSGRTLNEALGAAAEELEVAVETLEYTIIEEGGKGFLGLALTPYQIKAWVCEQEEVSKPAETTMVVIETTGVEVLAPESEASEVAPAGKDVDSTEILLGILNRVLAAMNLNAKPALKSVDSEFVYVDIVGSDTAILIGKQGQTLDALQYLMTLALNTRTASAKRVVLDTDGYRERHQKMLEKMALDYATAVAEHQQEAVMDPQSARDRRIIHVTLVDHPDVYTYSEGEGEERHVVISPKK